MVETKILSKEYILKGNSNLKVDLIPNQIKVLFQHQKKNWQMFREGWEGFQKHQTKIFKFGKFSIKVQFNPTRFVSSSAKVDSKSISQRRCFLCIENLPPEQMGILFSNKLLILCNPAPIFNEHYTIIDIKHSEQMIQGNVELMLELTKETAGCYTIFYNGPRCGASAPDHFHFQACPTDNLMTEIDIKTKSDLLKLIDYGNDFSISYFKNYLRKIILIRSSEVKTIIEKFFGILDILKEINNTKEEPLLNICSFYYNDEYYFVIFPRAKHRPSVFFDEGDDRILISPGLVDMAGTIITPIQKDFELIDEELITNIYDEVTIDDEKFLKLIERI